MVVVMSLGYVRLYVWAGTNSEDSARSRSTAVSGIFRL